MFYKSNFIEVENLLNKYGNTKVLMHDLIEFSKREDSIVLMNKQYNTVFTYVSAFKVAYLFMGDTSYEAKERVAQLICNYMCKYQIVTLSMNKEAYNVINFIKRGYDIDDVKEEEHWVMHSYFCNDVNDSNVDFKIAGIEEFDFILSNTLQDTNMSTSSTLFPVVYDEVNKRLVEGHYYVLKRNGKVISQAYIETCGDIKVIHGVYTTKKERGKGYAKLLIKLLTNNISASGYTPILTVDKNNVIARKLYSSVGYYEVGHLYNFIIK